MKPGRIISLIIIVVIGILAGRFAFERLYYDKPEEDFVRAFDALKSNSKEEAKKYIDYNSFWSAAGSEEFYRALISDFEYTLDAVETDESDSRRALAHVTVSNRDFKKIYGEFVVIAYQKAIDNTYAEYPLAEDELKAEIDAFLLEMLKNEETDKQVYELTLNMTRSERSWYIETADSDIDLIFGKFLTARTNAETVLGDMSSEALATLESAYKEVFNDSMKMIRNTAHFIVDDIWNGNLRHIVSCIDAGTDADGGEYDLEEGLKQLDYLRTELIRFDINIESLEGDEYAEIKTAWNGFMQELDRFADEIIAADPEPEDYDYEPDPSALISAMQKFSDLAYDQTGK